jgi:hypothetical protein
MAAILESEAGATWERNWSGGAGVAQLGRQRGRRRVVQGGTCGAMALNRLDGGGFGHDGTKGMMRLSGLSWAERPSGPGVLGRPISEKKRKKIKTGWAARGCWAKIRSGRLRKIKIVFNFLIQGNGIQIKRFKYFQTEFELYSK